MTPKSGLFLGVSCVAFISVTGCIFELSSGQPDFGTLPTAVILALSLPLGLLSFITAIRIANQSQG